MNRTAITVGHAFFLPFSTIRRGTRFDVAEAESRRVSGIHNFRQALASPYSVSRQRSGAALRDREP
jgi:hypothetical protein